MSLIRLLSRPSRPGYPEQWLSAAIPDRLYPLLWRSELQTPGRAATSAAAVAARTAGCQTAS